MTETAAQHSDTFNVPADGYDRLMGRYLPTLAPAFADAAGVGSQMRLLDVGCGPGGLTRELVSRAGAHSVVAIDPSPPFVEACRARNPGVDVRVGAAEQLPFEDDSFDAALASLVVGFMQDADAGVREMARVTKLGGIVAACFWDQTGMPALQTFWTAASAVDPSISGEMKRLGGRAGDITKLLTRAGLSAIEDGTIAASAHYESFDDWWSPFTLGIGPAGAYFQSLDTESREAIRNACNDLLDRPFGPFSLDARAWFARGSV
jgi:ubiquinone/menaquinone biosynthesis C-methylase UbiE